MEEIEARMKRKFNQRKLINSQKVRKCSFPSFRRKPESRITKDFWTPAFAGVTA